MDSAQEFFDTHSAQEFSTLFPTTRSTVVPTMLRFATSNPTTAPTAPDSSLDSSLDSWSDSSSDSSWDDSSNHPFGGALRLEIPVACFLILTMVAIRVWFDKKDVANPANYGRQRGHIFHNNRTHNNNNDDDDECKTKLSLDDWIALYNKTFDSNRNKLVLKSEHIVSAKPKGPRPERDDTNDDTNDDCEHDCERGDLRGDEDEAPSSLLILPITTGYNNSFRKSLSYLSSFASSQSSENTQTISGTCVICFDDFEKGDEIVWSSSSCVPDAPANNSANNNNGSEDDPTATTTTTNNINNNNNNNQYSCKHVYHKECMVHCLASNSCRRFNKKINIGSLANASEIENPCPVCRRNFCAIADEALDETIRTRALLDAKEREAIADSDEARSSAATRRNSGGR